MNRILATVIALAVLTWTAAAQDVISAKSGLIHHVSGQVSAQDATGAPLGSLVIDRERGQFPSIPEGGSLITDNGRAEVLLAPGVFLRVADQSQFHLLSDSLLDTRLRLDDGVFLLEVAEYNKENEIHIEMAGERMRIIDNGLYHFNVDPPVVRTYDGKVRLMVDDSRVDVKKGRFLPLDGTTTKTAKFDRKNTDAFYEWSQQRAGRIAHANMATARTIAYNGGYSSFSSSRWFYSPYLGMFTYLPSRGIFSSPFGYRFWSPYAVYYTYINPPRQTDMWGDRGGGYRSVGPTPSGSSGTVRSAGPSMGSSRGAAAGSAPISRGSGSTGGRAR